MTCGNSGSYLVQLFCRVRENARRADIVPHALGHKWPRHGSAFDYFRNEVLDANNWFNDNTGLAQRRLNGRTTRRNASGGRSNSRTLQR